MSIPQLEEALYLIDLDIRDLVQEIRQRPWQELSNDPREEDLIQLQNDYQQLRVELDLAIQEANKDKKQIGRLLMKIINQIYELESEISRNPGDYEKRRLLTSYIEQRDRVQDDYLA